MNRLRPGAAQFFHDLAAGSAAHDRIVDEDDAFSLEDLAKRVELQLDADVAQPLVGLDEGARDVAALDQALAVGDAARFGEADGGRRARVGGRADEFGNRRGLPGPVATPVAT